MPRTYVCKTNRRDINENNMKEAIRNSLRKVVSVHEAARRYGVKRSTLQSRIKTLLKKKTIDEVLSTIDRDSGNESSDEEKKYRSKYTVKQVFTISQERELVEYIKKSSNLNYGLSYQQVRKLAYEFAQILPDCVTPTNWRASQLAGIEWLKGFMLRNQQLSLRKPESTSLNRAMAFNKDRLEEFFSNYVKVLEKHKFKPEQIYNLDETGIQTVMKPVKVVSTRGKKQVGQVASAERGELVTFVGIISAIGGTIPPVFVYPRIRNVNDFLDGAPISSIALGNKSGWMTSELFISVLKHIVEHTNCSTEKKILLLIDNHESHTSFGAIQYCRSNGIVLLSFPPHTTHRLQPLDIAVYGPFKACLNVAFNDYMLTQPAKMITIRQIAQLASRAFDNAFSKKNIISGFETPGIWPLNRLAFDDNDFMPSTVTDNSNVEDNSLTTEVEPVAIPSTSRQDSIEETNQTTPPPTTSYDHDDVNTSVEAAEPQTEIALSFSKDKEPIVIETPSVSQRTKLKIKVSRSLEELRPYPKGAGKKKRNRKIPSKSYVYTDTPVMKMKENIEIEKRRKEELKRNKGTIKKLFPIKPVPKKILNESSSDSDRSMKLVDTSDGEEFLSSSDELPLPTNLPNCNDFCVGDCVMVKFATKATICYYIGHILKNTGCQEYEINFLRRKNKSNTFMHLQVEDISIVKKTDIIAVLSQASKLSTARTSSLYIFNYNFEGLNVR